VGAKDWPKNLRFLTSAGGVLYRQGPQGPQVALILVQSKSGPVWTLPKGLVDEGESLPETALREAQEETGLKARLVEKIGEISYWYYMKEDNAKCKKTVHYYLMQHVGGSTREHDQEVQEARWFPLEEAIQVVGYKGDREILRKVQGMLHGQGA
jgi:bis(5'-nucleosidyl)-tetraphosphatase